MSATSPVCLCGHARAIHDREADWCSGCISDKARPQCLKYNGPHDNHSYAVYIEGVSNGCRYAGRDEARRAGEELLSRWTAPSGFEVRPTDDPVNYEFPEGLSRPRSLARAGGVGAP